MLRNPQSFIGNKKLLQKATEFEFYQNIAEFRLNTVWRTPEGQSVLAFINPQIREI